MKIGNIGKITFALGLAVFTLLAIRLFIIPQTAQSPERTLLGHLHNIDLGEMPEFADINDIPTKKVTFFNYLRPAIEAQNQIIIHERQFVLAIIEQIDNGIGLSSADEQRLQSIVNKYQYDVKSFTSSTLSPLLKRIDIIPVNMVLVQAANESGWGSSRFATEGFNFFGQWCFTEGCGLVPTSRDQGKNHEVAVFDSPKDSIIAYMINLNTHSAYRLFRSIRSDLREQKIKPTAEKLVFGLVNYSERKHEYIDELLEMLKHNKPYLTGTKANA
ncbi:glycoside hydrolase family 73 [Shewanella algicola]|uniref:Glucosaminidase domain-containing protein n=1 Tax=Shewanella algicola TaxID=640633 RepID=A0A9X1ZF66_9GAMM|nr:glucosaminidase domain-containing protein [Shewanella algicola]MCL1105793.1 glucosaminidase domain-containing protein [Shewanella algicola]GGP55273.1 glycoside hydrolase family 73 [Shewanella algicola]